MKAKHDDTPFVKEMEKLFASIKCKQDFKVAKSLLKKARKKFLRA